MSHEESASRRQGRDRHRANVKLPAAARRSAIVIATGLVVGCTTPVVTTAPATSNPAASVGVTETIVASAPALFPSEGIAAFTIDLETAGQSTQVAVLDPEGLVRDARPADLLEAEAAMTALDQSDIVAIPGRAGDSLIVAWLVTPCDRHATMTVTGDLVEVVLPPRHGCDAIAIVRAVTIRLADSSRIGRLRPRFVDAKVLPEPEPLGSVAPPPTAEG